MRGSAACQFPIWDCELGEKPCASIPNRVGLTMKHHRRQFLHLAAGVAVLPTLACYVRAEVYPDKPVNLIVTFPAGSGPDIIGDLRDNGCRND